MGGSRDKQNTRLAHHALLDEPLSSDFLFTCAHTQVRTPPKETAAEAQISEKTTTEPLWTEMIKMP